MSLHPATTLLMSFPSNGSPKSDVAFYDVAPRTEIKFNLLSSPAIVLAPGKSQSLVVRASRDEGILWITLQNPVNLHMVQKKTPVFVQSHDSRSHVQDLENGHSYLLCQFHTIWLCWRHAGNHAGQHHSLPSGPRTRRCSESYKGCCVAASDQHSSRQSLSSTRQIMMMPIPTFP